MHQKGMVLMAKRYAFQAIMVGSLLNKLLGRKYSHIQSCVRRFVCFHSRKCVVSLDGSLQKEYNENKRTAT